MTLPDHYRIYDVAYGDGIRIGVEVWHAIRETPEGYWIRLPGYEWWADDEKAARRAKVLKWVSKTAVKRYAYPTLADSAASFRRRKEVQVSRLKFQLMCAEFALEQFANVDPARIAGRINVGKPDDYPPFYDW